MIVLDTNVISELVMPSPSMDIVTGSRDASDVFATNTTNRRKAGRPISQFDAQIPLPSPEAPLATRNMTTSMELALMLSIPGEFGDGGKGAS
ncbi:PIN domain-containing protein [Rhizobium mongolense]|uniref:hypothetical protein n=1 Tax=Rhizobium mongolense TaxID=57676 RepID=UPI000A767941|nr:hypothetical protein [Rhizobium mongolense]